MDSPTQFTAAAYCQEDSVLSSYKGCSFPEIPGKEVRGQDTWEWVSLLSGHPSAPHLPPDLEVSGSSPGKVL